MNGDAADRKVLCDIAHCAFDVINRILERDQKLANLLRSEQNSSHQFFREECITADMAATLIEKFPQKVEITLFTSGEEKKTGADWYWRIEKGNRAIHAYVQAKRVQRTQDDQEDKDGKIDINLKQLWDLINAPKNEELGIQGLQTWLATFARYEKNPPCKEELPYKKNDLNSCENHKHLQNCESSPPSLWIAEAKLLYCSLQDPKFGMIYSSFQEILRKTISASLLESQLESIIENLGPPMTNSVPKPVEVIIDKSIRLDCFLPCVDIDKPKSNKGPLSLGFYLRDDLPNYEDCIKIIMQNERLHKKLEGGLKISI